MAYSTVVARHKTREVNVGGRIVGGDNPIWVQSMTTTNTFDVAETLAQIKRLEEAGCELIRVTVPKKEDVEACRLIRDQINIPLIADIHYDYRMALACLEAVTPQRQAGGRQDPDQPGQPRRRGPVQGGHPQGPRPRHPDADRRQLGEPGEGPDREVRVPLPRGAGGERPAAHRDGRGAGLPRDDRLAEGEPRADGRRHATRSSPRRAATRRTSGSPRRARGNTAP